MTTSTLGPIPVGADAGRSPLRGRAARLRGSMPPSLRKSRLVKEGFIYRPASRVGLVGLTHPKLDLLEQFSGDVAARGGEILQFLRIRIKIVELQALLAR